MHHSGQYRAVFHQPQWRTALGVTQPDRYTVLNRGSISPMPGLGTEQILRDCGRRRVEQSHLCSQQGTALKGKVIGLA